MKYSQMLIKTRKETGKEIESVNADLLIRGSYIDQLSAGVYTFLPLGLRVLKKIENIVRDEMEIAHGQEVLMPVLQSKEAWKTTGRWDTLDDLFKFTSHYTKTETALGPTHEEVVSPLVKKFVFSYKDLPKYIYQIQTKFRDEKRAKAGLLRGREFLMKDLYSFHVDQEDLDKYYDSMKNSYMNIYNRVGIGKKTYLTFASGGSFSKYSHEFQTESDSGEDLIYLCEKCNIAVNKEIIDEQNECPECKNKKLKEIKAIEVGNIFKLGTKYSKPFNLVYSDEKNVENDVVMGCYGIGIGRVMGTVVEVSHDEKGIIWPAAVAPFDLHLIDLGTKRGEEFEQIFEKENLSVLLDDRDETAGTKFTDAELLGMPISVILSEKNLAKGQLEIKIRKNGETKFIDSKNVEKELRNLLNSL